MKGALPAPRSGTRASRKRADVPATLPRAESVQPGDSGSGRWIVILAVLGLGIGALLEYPPARELAARGWQALRLASVERAPESRPRPSEPAAEPATAAKAAVEKPGAALIERVREAASVLPVGPLQRVADLSSEGMGAALGPDGRVLLTSKYRVMSLGAGNANDRRTIYSPERYRAAFPNASSQAMASALALPDGRSLLGGWHGEVLLASDDGLQQLSTRDQRPRGRVTAMLSWNGGALIAGDGLWFWQPGAERLQEWPLPTPRRLGALAARGDQLLIAEDGPRIYESGGQALLPWLELPDAARVEAMVPAADGGWWIANTRGLLHVDARGEQGRWWLRQVWTTAVVERADGELWLGSWKQGLLLHKAGRWYRLGQGLGGLEENSVSGLVVDARDQVWLSLYGGGAWQVQLDRLRAALLAHPWTPSAEPAS